MLRNHLKIAFRNFMRYKGYTSLNIIGLAIGIASSLLILQYVVHELSYDKFHTDLDRIYRIRYDFYKNGERQFKCASTFPGVGPAAKNDFPEVEAYTRLYLQYGGEVVRYQDISIKEQNIFMGEPSFFDIFSYELVKGNPETALANPYAALIAKDMVEKYFKDEDPMGKTIRLGSDREFEITGILRSPENSHLKFSFLLSLKTAESWGENMAETLATNWGWYDFYNYIKLAPGADPKDLEAKFPEFVEKHTREGAWDHTRLALQPVEDIHLYSDLIQEARVNGNGTVTYVLLTIAFFILIIAWINYINLATARSMDRAREVGIRKVVGAQKGQLIRQFITESVVLNVLAAILAVIIFELFYGYFNQLSGKNLEFNILTDNMFWLALTALFLIGAFFSGLYPAFVLSSYKPISVLKGRLATSSGGVLLRKTLVVGQFFASALLITGTIIVYQQISFMRGQDLGIDIEKTLVINAPGVIANDSVYSEGLNVFKQELLNNANIRNVTSSTEVPGNLIYWTNGARRPGEPPESSGIMYRVGVDYDYVPGYNHEILAGRNFSKDFGTDEKALILNETALKMLGFESASGAVGGKVLTGGDTLSVIGVISDYHQQGLKQSHNPIAFLLRPESRSYYSVKIKSRDFKEVVSFIGEKYSSIFPGNPYDYFFLDDFFDRQYQSEMRFGKVFGLFSTLAILVACLGLLGLSAFSANQRTKEISIRKVLGSSISGIFVLLSKDYFRLILLANILAIPVAWWGMNQWLETFAFSINISFWVFLLSIIVTILIAFGAVSYQSIKAAYTDPANALRNE